MFASKYKNKDEEMIKYMYIYNNLCLSIILLVYFFFNDSKCLFFCEKLKNFYKNYVTQYSITIFKNFN